MEGGSLPPRERELKRGLRSDDAVERLSLPPRERELKRRNAEATTESGKVAPPAGA